MGPPLCPSCRQQPRYPCRDASGRSSIYLRHEARYSRYRHDSIVSRLISARWRWQLPSSMRSSGALWARRSLWHASGGLFDITSGPLRRAWDFRMNGGADPTHIEPALSLVGWDRIERTHDSLRLPECGMEVDLGGRAKEYAVDCATQHLRTAGITSGVIELAGDVGAIGCRPDGTPWRMAFRTHARRTACAPFSWWIGVFGNYARRIEYEGKSMGICSTQRQAGPSRDQVCRVIIAAASPRVLWQRWLVCTGQQIENIGSSTPHYPADGIGDGGDCRSIMNRRL